MRWSAAFFLLSCSPVPTAEDVCPGICQTLVSTCGFAAFPDRGSCLDGCYYEASQGAQIATYANCLAVAECDTFAVLRCQHAFGAPL